MQQIFYAVLAAVIIGLYLRDSGILSSSPKETINSINNNNSQQKVAPALAPKIIPEEIKAISLPSASTSSDKHSLRILFCTS